jgi:hypothetical protein
VRIYVERGKPVVVLVRWGAGGGPRNVLIRREDGCRVVRPFRGLRRGEERPADPDRLLLRETQLEDS